MLLLSVLLCERLTAVEPERWFELRTVVAGLEEEGLLLPELLCTRCPELLVAVPEEDLTV